MRNLLCRSFLLSLFCLVMTRGADACPLVLMEEPNGGCGARSMSQVLGSADVNSFAGARDETPFGLNAAGAPEYVASTVIGARERVVDFDWVTAQGLTKPLGVQGAAPAVDLVPWVRGVVDLVPWQRPSPPSVTPPGVTPGVTPPGVTPPGVTPPGVTPTVPVVQVPESATLIFLGVGLLSLSWGYRRLTIRL